MTGLRDHIEALRRQLTEMASGELALVRALGEALTRVDEKLLQDVREVTAAHDLRRGAILGELQTLASRIGAFPRDAAAQPAYEQVAHMSAFRDAPTALSPGDWRQAARNIEDDLDFVLDDLDDPATWNGLGHRHYGSRVGYS